tara:strand:- start:260 stop:475 length:216 start_codon:yes stop_codon:yes gene_type:complete
MPGLGNRRRAIQEGRDWTKEGTGYMGGGHVTGYKGGGKVSGGVKIMPNYGSAISSSISKSKKPKKKNLRRR